jgi:hypothetical protein
MLGGAAEPVAAAKTLVAAIPAAAIAVFTAVLLTFMLSIPFVSNGHTLDKARQPLTSPALPFCRVAKHLKSPNCRGGAQLPARKADISLSGFVPLCAVLYRLCAAARFVSHHRINTGIKATIT